MARIPIPPNAPGGIREEDFAFSFIDIQGNVWDTYHFMMNSHAVINPEAHTPGTLAFRYDASTKSWQIGILCKGHLNQLQCFQKLQPRPKEN